MTRRWARRRTEDPIVLATRRLMSGDPTPETVRQWMADLRTVAEAVLAPPLPSTMDVYAEVSAQHVLELLETVKPTDLINLMTKERGKWVA